MAENRFSDRDIEQLLSALVPENEELAALAPILRMLKDQSIREVSEDEVAVFAPQAAQAARWTISTASKPDQKATVSTSRRRLLRPRLAMALASVVLLSGMTGVAFASNGAAPGDPLYGLDRALERIGIGDGAAAERIAEAQALFQEGLVAEAMAHAAGAVAETEDASLLADGSGAAEALRDAAEAITSIDQGEADEVRAKVAEMLNWMADNAVSEEPLTGRDFGEMVAGFAKGISTKDDPEEGDAAQETEGTTGRPEGVPGGPPQGVPQGPPANVPPRP